MEIKGKVHLFFEQSGTFKNEFIKLGIPAEGFDYARSTRHMNKWLYIAEKFKEAK